MSRIFEALQHVSPELSRLAEPDGGSQGFSSLSAFDTGALCVEEAKRFRLPKSPAARLVAWREPNCLASENFRRLSAHLRYARQSRTVKRVLVTSPIRGDGKSVVSANLAIALASHGERTLLLDGDLHRPSISSMFSLDGSRGFATWHEEPAESANLLYRAESLPLWVLPAGNCSQQPLTVIQSSKTSKFVEQLASVFTWVVVDSPPLVPLADSGIWTTLCDVVVMVTRDGVTPKNALIDSIHNIDKSKLFAIVMNDAQSLAQSYYNSYYSATAHRKSRAGS